MSTEAPRWRIGLIGYGEVGRILAEDLRARDMSVSAYDVKLTRSDAAAALEDHAAEHGVRLAESHADAAAGADLGTGRCGVDVEEERAARDCARASHGHGHGLARGDRRDHEVGAGDRIGMRRRQCNAVSLRVPPHRGGRRGVGGQLDVERAQGRVARAQVLGQDAADLAVADQRDVHQSR